MAVITFPDPGSMVYEVKYPEALALFVERVQILYRDRKVVERVQERDLGLDLCEDCAEKLATKANELNFAANTVIEVLALKCPNCLRRLNSSCYDQSRCTNCKATLAFVPLKEGQ